jgi:hypothetical protein
MWTVLIGILIAFFSIVIYIFIGVITYNIYYKNFEFYYGEFWMIGLLWPILLTFFIFISIGYIAVKKIVDVSNKIIGKF